MVLAAMVLAASDVPAAPVLILMFAGVALAIFGHLYGSNTVVGFGIFVVFLATIAMVVGGYIAYNDDPKDPRPKEDNRTF
ncbi:MAG TPA: hypothetical protein VN238_21975 [Solirubrobacteraceae bacterium]|nr:hypothetical protein [Solirubrobacteraceae bacterium]